MRIYLILSIVFFRCSLQAQSGNNIYNIRVLESMALDINQNKSLDKGIEENNYDGSPYLQDSFKLGSVNTSKGLFNNVKLRYNVIDDIFLFEIENRQLYLEPNSYVKKVEIDGHIFVVKKLPDSKKQYDFVRTVDSNKISIYTKYIKLFKPAEAPKAIEAKLKPPTFLDRPNRFYIQLGNGPLIWVEKQKDLYSIFPFEEDIKKFIKTNDYSFKKEADLIQIIQYCGQKL